MPQPGDELVMFLSPATPEPGRFHWTDGPFGAFRIVDGNVLPLTTQAARPGGDWPKTVPEFERRIYALIDK